MRAAGVLRRRAARIYDEKSLGMTSKFLEVNPECYTVWNFRREMLTGIFAKQSEEEEARLKEEEARRKAVEEKEEARREEEAEKGQVGETERLGTSA